MIYQELLQLRNGLKFSQFKYFFTLTFFDSHSRLTCLNYVFSWGKKADNDACPIFPDCPQILGTKRKQNCFSKLEIGNVSLLYISFYFIHKILDHSPNFRLKSLPLLLAPQSSANRINAHKN